MKLLVCAWVFLFGAPAASRAVIFLSTGDPNYNTTAPAGALAGSGWQWVGSWQGFAGTPIGDHYFLAARHIGGTVGDPFTFDGVNYTTTAFFDDATTDLRICQVSGTFPTWAPLYRASGEVGSPLVVFGFGLGRGGPVMVGATLNGWLWAGGTGGVLRWGQNTVTSIINGGSYWGQLLYATFDSNGGANEAHLASGDSSGPVFINDGTGWQLAGIAAAVDGPFNTTNTGNGFNAALFDVRGLYVQQGASWVLVTGPVPVPSGFYATQVSVRTSWIDSIVPVTPVQTDTPLLSGGQTIFLAGCILAAGAVALSVRQRTPAEAAG